ncbi:unnamed protein product [Echinostoma caproni]|uniref:ANK_REP_REGION domain-containing protein n=1 Tax=Echinostoma caproni TaxID=27848 RepID=A0A183AA38_9TREM|nr:unnamed protein product [Echinostoma caproni]
MIQVQDLSLTRRFQDYLIHMVTRRVSNRSLDQMSTPAHSDHVVDQSSKSQMNIEQEIRPNESSDREVEEDVLSMASEANISTSDIFSQRCTVIAASPSKRRAVLGAKSGGSALEVDSSFNVGSERTVSFVFPEHFHHTQQRPVPDPIAFIHIDMPLFPLSAFAPSTSRHLPLPLRSTEDDILNLALSGVPNCAVELLPGSKLPTPDYSDFPLTGRQPTIQTASNQLTIGAAMLTYSSLFEAINDWEWMKRLCWAIQSLVAIFYPPFEFLHCPMGDLSCCVVLFKRFFRLQSVLRSSPKPSTDARLVCCPDPVRTEENCSCCVCPTKATLEKRNRAKLAARWGQLVENTCGENAIEQACAEHTREDLIYPVCSGLTTLLAHEERDIRRQLTAWQTTDIRASGRHTKLSRARFPSNWPLESPCRCRCPERHRKPVPPLSLWESLFGPSPSIRAELRRSPVATVVEHLGRVYHPAIITLLMHARDREHNPLDFTHPAIQTSISIITTPQREFDLIRRLRQQVTDEPLTMDYPAHLAISMGSDLAHDPTMAHAERTHSPKARSDRGSVKLLRRKQVLSESFVKDSNSALNASGRRPHSIWAGDSQVVEPTTATQLSAVPQNQTHTSGAQQKTGSVRRAGRKDETVLSGVGPHGSVNQQMLFGWDDTNALIAGYWSGMETPGYDLNGPDYSVGTPTVSLYGTEDAATTEDLDDTEDNVSLSSMNQCEYMENFLSATTSHEQSNRTLFMPDRPQNLPLAVPELLTTSATTAGSNEQGSLIDNEIDHEYLQSYGALPAYSISAAASSTVLASGAASTAVTPGSSEILRLQTGSPEPSFGSPANTMAGSPPRDFETPDLLAGMPNSSGPQSPSTGPLEQQDEVKPIETLVSLHEPETESAQKTDANVNRLDADQEQESTLESVVIM